MKPILYGALILGLSATPTVAQQAATPPALVADAKLETDAARILSADFVRSSIYIGYGNLSERKTGDKVYLTFPLENYKRLKGADDTRFAGFLAPDAARAFLGKKVLVFARFDGTAKRGVISGIAPATDGNVARVKALIAANPTLEISVTTSKPQYALGEPIVVDWKIKNVSGAPLSIYTGEHAAHMNLLYGGGSRSWSDENARKRPIFTRLQPDEIWEYERVFDKEFSVGPVGVEYYYSASDALEVRRAAPDDLFLEQKRGELSVEVVPATAEQRAQLLKQLESPVWTQQLEAAKLVLQSGNAKDIEMLERFAEHPDARLREVAAQALIAQDKFSTPLKRLFYAGTELDWRPFKAGDFSLAFLASNELNHEATQRGILGKSRGLVNTPRWVNDPRAGDLLATWLRDEARYGAELAEIVGLRAEIQNTGEPLSADLKARVLEAWQAKRASVKNIWTPAQFKSELDLARQVRYNDYQKGPFYNEVAAILDDGEKRDFLGGAEMDVINKRIRALPAEAVPTLIEAMRWRAIQSPPAGALEMLADSAMPDKFVRLAQVAYGRNDSDARELAIELMAELDYQRALPHLEAWMKQAQVSGNWNDDAPRLTAAAILGNLGDKRAVPVLLAPRKKGVTTLDEKKSVAALQKATGLAFVRLSEWRKWWDEEGAQKEWE